jgi:hypothetical protein
MDRLSPVKTTLDTILRLYNEILHAVEIAMGTRSVTYDVDLDKWGRLLIGKNFRGVFMEDTVPLLSVGHMAIVNVDRAGQPGSHWMAVVQTPRGRQMFDSFGRNTADLLPTVAGGHSILPMAPWHKKSKQLGLTDAKQPLMASDCGQRSLAYLLFCHRFGDEAALLI